METNDKMNEDWGNDTLEIHNKESITLYLEECILPIDEDGDFDYSKQDANTIDSITFYKTETINLIKITDDEIGKKWIKVNKEDIFLTIFNKSLQIVSKDMIIKYNIKNGDNINKLRENKEFENDLANCKYVDRFLDCWIILDDLEDYELYISNNLETIFNKSEIESWDKFEGYFYYNGSNSKMLKVEDTREFEAREIYSEYYKRETLIRTYKLENSKEFKIDDIICPRGLLTVETEYNNIIEDI